MKNRSSRIKLEPQTNHNYSNISLYYLTFCFVAIKIAKKLLYLSKTSGYFAFHDRPEGKCLHGGSLDELYSGVNKDTSSKCFSPHHELHQTAANLAVEVDPFSIILI